jgi:gliding motility-associated-like protein
MVLLALVLMGILASGVAWGKSEYVIGEGEHPWGESGTFEHIDTWTAPGSMQVVYIEPTQNLVEWLDPKHIYGTRPIPTTQITDPEKISMVDQDLTTAYVHRPEWNTYYFNWHALAVQFDLGGLFPVNRIRFSSREEFRTHLISEYQVRVAEDFPGTARWHYMSHVDPIVDERENLDLTVDLSIPLQPVRFVGIRPLTPTETWEIAEVEVYGEGYLPHVASYTSNVISFESVANWGKIRWNGWRDEGAKVEIQTRSGSDDTPDVYWRKTGVGDEQVWWSESGKPLTMNEYYASKPDERGRITHDVDHWSFWSAPYDFEEGLEGVTMGSPSPRAHAQVRVTITPTNTDGAGLNRIALEFSHNIPAAEVLAEIAPVAVSSEAATAFTYVLRPRIEAENTGFDHLEISTPAPADTVRAVRIDGVEVDFTHEIREDRFVVCFPKVVRDQTLIEVMFDCLVLGYTRFDGWVFDSGLEEPHQLVDAGNVTDALPGNTLLVTTALEGPMIVAVKVAPTPFTPNGDGNNDVVHISYHLLKLTGSAPVSLDMYDLSGTLVKKVYRGNDPSRRTVQSWDGTDENGEVVPPGVYFYRLTVRTDEKEENRVGTVTVVY